MTTNTAPARTFTTRLALLAGLSALLAACNTAQTASIAPDTTQRPPESSTTVEFQLPSVAPVTTAVERTVVVVSEDTRPEVTVADVSTPETESAPTTVKPGQPATTPTTVKPGQPATTPTTVKPAPTPTTVKPAPTPTTVKPAPTTVPAPTIPPTTLPAKVIGSCQQLDIGPANQWRADLGLPALAWSSSYYSGACNWATHLANTGGLQHQWWGGAETLYSGGSCSNAWSAWRNSSGHYYSWTHGGIPDNPPLKTAGAAAAVQVTENGQNGSFTYCIVVGRIK